MMKFELKNCAECGVVFSSVQGVSICLKCRRVHDDEYTLVKDFVYANPDVTVLEVMEETGVSEEEIIRFLKEGRLELTGKDGAELLKCERCDKPIRVGRFCTECTEKMSRQLKRVGQEVASNLKRTKDRPTQSFHTKKNNK